MRDREEIESQFRDLRRYVDEAIFPKVNYSEYCALLNFVDSAEDVALEQEDERTNLLKPCPFCGFPVHIEKVPMRHYSGSFTFDIKCRNPGCRCEVRLPENDTVYRSEELARENAIRAWNKRAKGV
jgi:hypothetical protein